MGRAIAKEARAQGAHIGYGPVLDLARDPRWSRVEETYGEDPFLIGKMGEALVRGFQGMTLTPRKSSFYFETLRILWMDRKEAIMGLALMWVCVKWKKLFCLLSERGDRCRSIISDEFIQ